MKKVYLILLMAFIWSLGYSQTGSLDPTFGIGGKVLTTVNSGQDMANGIVIQPDGKIIVAGYTQNAVTGKDFLCIRYDTNGTIDLSFGVNGIVKTDLQTGSDDAALCLTLDLSNNIIVAGYSDDGSNKNAAIVRYKPNGTLDSTFGTNGITITNFQSTYQDEIHAVEFHPASGKIVVGGVAIISSSLAKPVVARYLPDGTLDTTFNSTGIKTLWVHSTDSSHYMVLNDLKVQSNGKISAVGYSDFPGLSWDTDYWACRINSNGTMDATFAGIGVALYNDAFNGADKLSSLYLLPSGNIIGAGGGYITTLSYDFRLFEITSSGVVGNLSATVSANTGDDFINGMVVDGAGRYVVAGYGGTSTNSSFVVGRVTAAGAFDNAFAANGYVSTTFGGNTINVANDVAVQSDNKIVVAGYSGSDIALARYVEYKTVGVNSVDKSDESGITIYPNPASYSFYAKNNSGNQNWNLTLVDALGKVVLEESIQGTSSKEIFLDGLSSGVYFVKVIVEGKPFFRKINIVQK